VIARIWKGITRQEDRDTYLDYLNKTGLPDYKATKGNRGVWVLCRVFEGNAEFTLISLWESWDAIKAFAGPEYEKAVYYPEDRKFLLSLDPHVTHYEVLATP
jgi:heme-degrading monooxygenase HmoA